MTHYSRRTVLKTGAAFAGASALGFPAIVRAQATRIKIGHLTPLTGFLGAIGSYAQLGVKMAAEEINQSGGIMGKQIDLMSEDSVNPATASTKAQQIRELIRVFEHGKQRVAQAHRLVSCWITD
jgi:branched-chain amino acid transport system substrate-binding protein